MQIASSRIQFQAGSTGSITFLNSILEVSLELAERDGSNVTKGSQEHALMS